MDNGFLRNEVTHSETYITQSAHQSLKFTYNTARDKHKSHPQSSSIITSLCCALNNLRTRLVIVIGESGERVRHNVVSIV